MPGGRYLDLSEWPRRTQFEFFRGYELPFFNICAEVPVGQTLAWCREKDQSFALACWYLCQRAVNSIEPFRYRMRDDRVWVHDQVRVAMTALNSDETFRFCYLDHAHSFASFCEQATAVLERPATDSMDDRPGDDGVIHGSTLPWVRFTGIAHARRLTKEDSVPKIVFGKYGQREGEVMMPVSVEVHHALMDGLHASRFFEHIERDLSRPEQVLGGQS
ncbi:MAG: chloramphenicol O-acetyltransferase type A [Candidatus Paceibacteria bacterium]|jgi:chloramphenicol O-acetyltransferase type A